jgi:hypothetical protein
LYGSRKRRGGKKIGPFFSVCLGIITVVVVVEMELDLQLVLVLVEHVRPGWAVGSGGRAEIEEGLGGEVP